MNVRTLIVAALVVVAGSFALAQTTDVAVTLSSANSMTVNTTSVALTPKVGAPDADSSTTIDYSTNDGSTHTISVAVSMGGWTFAPEVTGNTTPEWPVLTFVSASTDATAGSPGTSGAQTVLIDNANALTGADVLTGISNTSGTATVTLESSITQNVTAGTYTATLTYTFN